MLDLPVEISAALPEALTAQQGSLVEAYQAAIGSQVVLEPGEDIVASHQAALEKARDQRLRAERLPRFLVAALLAVVLLAWFIWKRRTGIALVYPGRLDLPAAIQPALCPHRWTHLLAQLGSQRERPDPVHHQHCCACAHS